MAISYLSRATNASEPSSHYTTTFSSSAGADCIIVSAARGTDTSALVVTDNTYSNSITSLTRQITGNNLISQLFYRLSPVVGSSHQFSIPNSGGGDDIDALAFSGVGSFYSESGAVAANNTDTTIQPGSLTAPEDGCLFVTSVSFFGGQPVSIDSSFNILYPTGGQNGFPSCVVAYKIQTTAGAENPTWTYPNGFNLKGAAVMACFKAAIVPLPKGSRRILQAVKRASFY